MKPNKNIDRLFQEKLKDLEVLPPDIVWKNIENSLKKKKERRVFPIWLRIGTAAAILLLATIVGVNYFKVPSNVNEIIITDVQDDKNQKTEKNSDNSFEIDRSENDSPIITSVDNTDGKNSITKIVSSDVNSENNNSVDTSVKSEVNSQKISADNTTTVANNNDNSITETVKNKNDVSKISEVFDSNNNSEKTALVVFENQQEKLENKDNFEPEDELQSITINQNNKSIDNLTANQSTETKNTSEEKNNAIVYENIENLEDTLTEGLIDEPEEIDKKWSVASVFAPVYYNSFNTKGSPLDLQFENSPKEGSSSVSYGIKVGYQFNKKLILQSGVTLVNVGYTIGDVYINPSPQFASRLANVNYQTTATILNVNAANVLGQTQIETSTTIPLKGELSQEYGYVEVPLELKFRVTNGKLGVHVVGGFSTLFLNDNDVLVETSEFSSNLGEANNLNTINFSANFGLDLDYDINKNLFINVAPMIKIHTNTFSENSENFEPYIIGFYTGLNYRF